MTSNPFLSNLGVVTRWASLQAPPHMTTQFPRATHNYQVFNAQRWNLETWEAYPPDQGRLTESGEANPVGRTHSQGNGASALRTLKIRNVGRDLIYRPLCRPAVSTGNLKLVRGWKKKKAPDCEEDKLKGVLHAPGWGGMGDFLD